jgi:hypothetical protein
MTDNWLVDQDVGQMPGRAVRRDVFRGILILGLLGLTGIPGRAQDAESGEVAGGVRVPEINDQGVMTSLLTGREVRFRPRKPMEIKGLEVFFFEPDGVTVRMNAVSPGCFYDSNNGKAFSDEPIRIEGNGFVITGTRYEYMASEQTMEIFEDAKVVFKNVNLVDLTPSSPADLPEAASESDANLTLTP